MFKNLNRYHNYVLNCEKKKNPLKNLNIIKKNYTKIIKNQFYINKHNKIKKKQLFFFLFNHNVLKKSNFFLKTINFFFKNILIKKNYINLFIFLNKNEITLKKHWLFNFYCNFFYKKKNFFYTNKIEYFFNQKLVKQPILIQYNYTNDTNTYHNHFKYIKVFNPKNIYFYKNITIYTKQNYNKFFQKQDNFLLKFINEDKLIFVFM